MLMDFNYSVSANFKRVIQPLYWLCIFLENAHFFSLFKVKKLVKRRCCISTCKPGFGVSVLCLLQPGLVPGMSKVHQQDELDDDENEGPHHTKVIPHWGQAADSSGWVKSGNVHRLTSQHFIPVVKVPSGMKKAPTVIPTSARNLKNQNLRQQSQVSL